MADVKRDLTDKEFAGITVASILESNQRATTNPPRVSFHDEGFVKQKIMDDIQDQIDKTKGRFELMAQGVLYQNAKAISGALSATHHDCLYVGGPRDGQIHETLKCMDTVVLGPHDNAPTYDRQGDTTTFVYRKPANPVETKAETWRDRAIRDPLF